MTTASYYKYRPLFTESGDTHPFTKSIFEDAELYFAAPTTFNDPFDCNLTLHLNDCSDDDWLNYINYLIKIHPSKRDNLNFIIENKLWRHQDCELHQQVLRSTEVSRREHYEESSVLCLSHRNNSTQMFAYYADDHKGIAIEFQFSDEEVICGYSHEATNDRGVPYEGKVIFDDVIYEPELPHLDYLKYRNSTPNPMITDLLFTKQKEWEHEREFRIFRRNIAPSKVKFSPQLLTRVILGSKTTPEDVELIKSWLHDWPTPVSLAKATQSTSSYSLVIEDFDTVGGPHQLQ